jgi:hypothetical protein
MLVLTERPERTLQTRLIVCKKGTEATTEADDQQTQQIIMNMFVTVKEKHESPIASMSYGHQFLGRKPGRCKNGVII